MDSLASRLPPTPSLILREDKFESIVTEYLDGCPFLDASDPININALIQSTQQLQNGGLDDPESWIHRAEYFLGAFVPELAVFDAHKALLLAVEGNDEQAIHKSTLVLAKALFFARCYLHCFELIRAYPGYDLDEDLEPLFNAASKALEAFGAPGGVGRDYEGPDFDGQVVVTKYPLLPVDLLQVQESTIESLNAELGRLTNSLCVIKKKPHVEQDGSAREHDPKDEYGIFVTQNIAQGTNLFTETSLLCHVDPPKANRCKYCLRDLSSSTPLTTSSNGDKCCDVNCANKVSTEFPSLHPALLSRLIAIAVKFMGENPDKHPLEAPEIACLAAPCGDTMLVSYDRHIVQPIEQLRSLGIDVFSDHKFDGSVIMNILARLENNEKLFLSSNEVTYAVFRFCTFIGSCRDRKNTAAYWHIDENGEGVRMVVWAFRDLLEGEELIR